MNDTKYGIIIDSDGYKTEFVLLQEELNEQGELIETPYAYTLQEGESVIDIDVNTAQSMLKPHWTGTEWEETASQQEIDDYYAPDEQVPTFSTDEFILGLIEALEGDEDE